MEGSGISRLDCYEDMFKEITRKLYGEDPDHRTSSVQNEFETSVSYKNDEDTENGIDGSDDGNWTCEEEPLKGTDGSRIASYHAGKAIWRCLECGDVSGSPRETAEHFMENHLRLTDDGRNRHHSLRKDYVDLKIEDVNLYLEKLRERAERAAPPSCRTQETQTIPQTLLQNSLLEMPSTSGQHLQNANMAAPPTTSTNTKRYNCDICAYGTDRHDLYTRHKNIHCENKPYQCYLCCKPFNRADHVKKHFTRIHREHTYDVSRIRTSQMNAISKQSTSHMQQESAAAQTVNANVNNQQQHANYQSAFVGNKTYQLQPNAGSGTATGSIYHTTNMAAPVALQQVTASCTTGRRVQNGGCNSKSHVKSGSKNTQDKRYTCDYCSWTGGDNWCLKRHMNTHTRPFPCSMCEYKAARAERLSTHVQKVHNRKICTKCSFLTEDQSQLDLHQKQVHGTGNASAPSTSTVQTALPPPSNNRHPGTFSQVGRPPPGPPVFPANPTIASTSAASMITPSTILGTRNSENCLSFSLITPCHGDEADKVSQDQAAEPIPEGSATRKRVFQRPESQNMSTSQVTNKRRRKQDRPTKCFLGLEDEIKSEDGINSSEGVVHGALKEEVQNNKQRFTYQISNYHGTTCKKHDNPALYKNKCRGRVSEAQRKR